MSMDRPLTTPSPELRIQTDTISVTESSANSSGCTSASSVVTSASSVSSPHGLGLLPTVYDGTHLHWKTFRQEVLAPHKIHILNSPEQALPEDLTSQVESSEAKIHNIEPEGNKFRTQIAEGRGFGPSPLFPPNLLPSIENEPKLTRCMVPSFNRESLPRRTFNCGASFYELSTPRPGLGCGFSRVGLTDDEFVKLPKSLVATGTQVDFSSGYIATGTLLCCPFLIFERTYGHKEYKLETASNYCAVGGAWCTRSLQLLYAQAWSDSHKARPFPPVTFSCAIDNDIAILNYHWIGATDTYCMAPIRRFSLSKEEDFHCFNVWIHAIEQWGLRTLLPNIKRALSRLNNPSSGILRVQKLQRPNLRVNTKLQEDKLVTALKTSFYNIPWRVDECMNDSTEDLTPSTTSSVTSWGSPVLDDMYSSDQHLDAYLEQRSDESLSTTKQEILNNAKTASQLSLTTNKQHLKPQLPNRQNAVNLGDREYRSIVITPQSQYMSKVSADQTDETPDLQSQLQGLKNELDAMRHSFQTEVSSLKNTLTTVLRKERVAPGRARSNSSSIRLSVNTKSMVQSIKTQSSSDFQPREGTQVPSVVTTPTEPNPRLPWERPKTQRLPSSLQQVMSINSDTVTTAVSPTKSEIVQDIGSTTEKDSQASKVLSMHSLHRDCKQPTPLLLTHSLLSSSPASPDGCSFATTNSAPSVPVNAIRWSIGLISIQIASFLIPSHLVQALFLGCITHLALFAAVKPGSLSNPWHFRKLLCEQVAVQ